MTKPRVGPSRLLLFSLVAIAVTFSLGASEPPSEEGGGLFDAEGTIGDNDFGEMEGDEALPNKGEASWAESSVFRSTPIWRLEFGIETAVDTEFSDRDFQIAELMLIGAFSLQVDLTNSLRFTTAPKFRYLVGLDESTQHRSLFLANIPEAFVTWWAGPVQLRVGTLVFKWGASDLIGPVDLLNPTDLRRLSLRATGAEKIPVPSIEAVVSFAPAEIRLVFQPFFVGARYILSGWDAALGPAVGIPDLEPLIGEENVERQQLDILVQEQPPEDITGASVAVRGRLYSDSFDFGTSFIFGWEPIPKVAVHPDLAQLLALTSAGVPLLDPAVAPVLDSVVQRAAAGEALAQGEFVRRMTVGVDFVWQLEPFNFKIDVAYTPGRLLYGQDGQADTYPWLNGVAGFEFRKWNIDLLVEGFVLMAFDVPPEVRLLFLDAVTDGAELDSTRVIPGVTGLARYSMFEDDVVAEVFALHLFATNDVLMAASISGRLNDHHSVRVGARILWGDEGSFGAAFNQTDQVFIGYSLAY